MRTLMYVLACVQSATTAEVSPAHVGLAEPCGDVQF